MADLPTIPLQFGEGIGNALASGAHARYYMDEARQKRDEEQRRKDAQPYIEPAMKGDAGAMAKVAAGDPKTAVAITSALSRMDANQRADAKAKADYTAQAANAILQADPKDRPAIYQQMHAEGQRRGYTMSLPPEYNPSLDPLLRSHRAMAIDINKELDRQTRLQIHNTPGGGGGIPTQIDMPGPGGGAPAPMPAAPTGAPRVSMAVPPAGGPAALPTQMAQAAPGIPGPVASPPGQVAQGDSPTADANGTPLPPAAKPQGVIWENDPTQQGYVMRGSRDKYGNVTPVEVGGHFLFRNPQTGEHVLYKPRPPQATERTMAPPGYRWVAGQEGQALEPIAGGPNDPTVAAKLRIPPGFRQTQDGGLEFIPGGPADPATAKRASPMNNEQSRDAGFADRMQNSNGLLGNLAGQGTKFWDRLSEKVPMAGGYAQSAEYQQFKQARDDFINAQLRRESGAAISKDEYDKADRQYFPQPGDKPEVIKQKALNRKLAVEGMIRGAGPSYKPSDSITPPGGAAAPAERPPLSSFEKRR